MRTLRALDEKPYIEIIAGRRVEKVSGTYRHGAIQLRLGGLVRQQGKEHGFVASEWRFHLCRDAHRRTTLVPDIAFVTREHLLALPEAERQMPPLSPDAAIEIRSPSGREYDIREKIALYLDYGSVLVLDVDPATRSITAHTREGARRYSEDERFSHLAVPWLRFDIADAFPEGD